MQETDDMTITALFHRFENISDMFDEISNERLRKS